jgi:cyclopropane-fatty-acyl-phospholipid synthase
MTLESNDTQKPITARRTAELDTLGGLFGRAGIKINGPSPWDIQIHDQRAASRILAQGSMGLGESYMDGWWDCASLDGFFERIFEANLTDHVTAKEVMQTLRARLFNLQDRFRSWQVGKAHYDVGNDLFSAMLDSRMTYSCGYWRDADNLEAAQTAKLDLVCRKLGLKPGMRLLDIGCGWGSLMKFAAEKYDVSCVGLTISKEQAEYARLNVAGLPIEFRLADYRSFNVDGHEKFDRIASIGMFEHVGHKNYVSLFETSKRSLISDGLFLLHTIGRKRRRNVIDPWFDRYIFPNGELPSLGEISNSVDARFVVEDVHNFGADYDQTLLAWYERFEAAWPEFASRYGDRFYRMWRYYLLCMAGCFRARQIQLWQIVLSPAGVEGGYQRPS